MDFGYSEENERFRQEVRQFFEENLTPELRGQSGENSNGMTPAQRDFLRKLADKGWIGMSWPKEYGGRGADRIEQFIFEEEAVRAGAPINVGNAVMEQGPAILLAGTEEQKQYFLPRMMRGEIEFCLGYTEPSGGTDLASLQCRAVEDGDEFVINGQKVFTSGAHHSTHLYLMARTDPEAPKHRGISIFLIPMDVPGITVRPLWTLMGGRTNEVFLDNVRVPKNTLLGEKNGGWYIGSMALNWGRSGYVRYYGYVSPFESILKIATRPQADGRALADDPAVRDKLAELYADAQVARLFTWRSISMARRGLTPSYETSAEKVWGPEFLVRSTEALAQVMGQYGQVTDGELAPDGGAFPKKMLGAMITTFGHGGVEVMRDAIARRGLGLPRA